MWWPSHWGQGQAGFRTLQSVTCGASCVLLSLSEPQLLMILEQLAMRTLPRGPAGLVGTSEEAQQTGGGGSCIPVP